MLTPMMAPCLYTGLLRAQGESNLSMITAQLVISQVYLKLLFNPISLIKLGGNLY